MDKAHILANIQKCLKNVNDLLCELIRTDDNGYDLESYLIAIGLENIGKDTGKYNILTSFWNTHKWPKNAVSIRELSKTSGVLSTSKRIRELIWEYGCDIQSIAKNGDNFYWLNSPKIIPRTKRVSMASVEKVNLFQEANYMCAICGVKMEPGPKGLQADHKIPLARGGNNMIENFQPICWYHNNLKRKACSSCEHHQCGTCPWAYPEKFSQEDLAVLCRNGDEKKQRSIYEEMSNGGNKLS